MTRLLAPALAILASPALADVGPHLHPHGSETLWLPLIVGTAAVAGLAGYFWGRR